MGKKPYELKKIDDRGYLIREDIGIAHGIMYLLWGDTSALLIDTGYGSGDLRALVSSITDKPVKAVNTHAHFDHIGANYQFGDCWIHRAEEPVLALHTDMAYLSEKLMIEQMRIMSSTYDFFSYHFKSPAICYQDQSRLFIQNN
jgi:glyoxylase-like metal-dependent hydrolase (beta-lactamase superfamily II)